MDVVAWLIFAILAPVSLLHFLWGCGMTWPGRDAQELSTIVVGVEGAEKMPGFFLTLIVSFVAFVLARATGLPPRHTSDIDLAWHVVLRSRFFDAGFRWLYSSTEQHRSALYPLKPRLLFTALYLVGPWFSDFGSCADFSINI